MELVYPDEINLALAIMRVSLGLMMFVHGYKKMFSGGRIDGTAGWFDSIGMKPGRLNAYLASLTEMGAGLLLAAGLLTSFAAAGIVGVMVVAFWTTHKDKGFMILNEGWEYVAIIAAMCICAATLGPGEWSIDNALKLDDDLDGWAGFWIAAGVGIGGGIAQMAIFYRPPKKDAASA